MFTPFRGLLFDPSVVGDTAAVTSPPYDVIDAEERTELASRSAHNVVRLLLPDDGAGQYQQVGGLFVAWRTSGALAADPSARFYLYEMTWDDAASTHTARGVVGSLVVEELGERVLPHEETMAGIRADRYAVLDATRANLDPIVALSASRRLSELMIPDSPPRITATAAGVTHRVFDITAEDRLAAIAAEVADHPVSIADGHHRYVTALAFGREREPGPWDGIMTMVAPAEGSGLTVAPYHRYLEDGAFDPAVAATAFAVEETLPHVPSEPGTIVLVTAAGAYLLTLRPAAGGALPPPLRAASAAVARDVLFPLLGVDESDASYTPRAEDVLAAVGRGGLGVLVAAVTEQAIAAASEAAIRFPQKTTYFTPKPRAGLVIRAFDLDEPQDEAVRRP